MLIAALGSPTCAALREIQTLWTLWTRSYRSAGPSPGLSWLLRRSSGHSRDAVADAVIAEGGLRWHVRRVGRC